MEAAVSGFSFPPAVAEIFGTRLTRLLFTIVKPALTALYQIASSAFGLLAMTEFPSRHREDEVRSDLNARLLLDSRFPFGDFQLRGNDSLAVSGFSLACSY
jgi:hypothetical protein